MTHYFKVLGPDRTPIHGGHGQWPEPGTWASISGRVIPCSRGYHLCRSRDLSTWLRDGCELWVAEARGEIVELPGKVVASEARLVHRTPWDDRVARLWACDCAERALDLYGRYVDPRSREAIAVARLYAVGAVSEEDLAAARSAARSAAGPAARSAAESAAESSAWSVAGFYSRSAAGFYSRSAARKRERKWQMRRLLERYLGLRCGWEDEA